jgi:DNA-binding CsgD family transcriptional regulator
MTWRLGLCENEPQREIWRFYHQGYFDKAFDAARRLPKSGMRGVLEMRIGMHLSLYGYVVAPPEKTFTRYVSEFSPDELAIARASLAVGSMGSDVELLQNRVREACVSLASAPTEDARREAASVLYRATYLSPDAALLCEEILTSDRDPYRRARYITRRATSSRRADYGPVARHASLFDALLLNEISEERSPYLRGHIVQSLSRQADCVRSELSDRVWEAIDETAPLEGLSPATQEFFRNTWVYRAARNALDDEAEKAYEVFRHPSFPMVKRNAGLMSIPGMYVVLWRSYVAALLGEPRLAKGELAALKPLLPALRIVSSEELFLDEFAVVTAILCDIGSEREVAEWLHRTEAALASSPPQFELMLNGEYQKVAMYLRVLAAARLRPPDTLAIIEDSWMGLAGQVPWKAARLALLAHQITGDQQWVRRAREQVSLTPLRTVVRDVEHAERMGGTLAGRLTTRQLLILEHLRAGLRAPAIADKLELSVNTVRVHTQAIHRVMGVNSRRELIESLATQTS